MRVVISVEVLGRYVNIIGTAPSFVSRHLVNLFINSLNYFENLQKIYRLGDLPIILET